ncbi:MAG: hypothetical protein IPL61_29865 [Myxococcales bacterium]|nr:hypothetical protein [Myxococcales bacterium]
MMITAPPPSPSRVVRFLRTLRIGSPPPAPVAPAPPVVSTDDVGTTPMRRIPRPEKG